MTNSACMSKVANHVLALSMAVACLLGTPHGALAGEPRRAVVINAMKPVAHIHARRSVLSDRLASLANGAFIFLYPGGCRNAKGTVVIPAYGKAFGKGDVLPTALRNMWCEVSYQAPGSDEIAQGWMRGKHVKVIVSK